MVDSSNLTGRGNRFIEPILLSLKPEVGERKADQTLPLSIPANTKQFACPKLTCPKLTSAALGLACPNCWGLRLFSQTRERTLWLKPELPPASGVGVVFSAFGQA